jgi:succinate-acetate transporter protein
MATMSGESTLGSVDGGADHGPWAVTAFATTSFTLGLGFSGGHTNLIKAGGWVTVAFAILAWCHAAADMVNFTFKRPMPPAAPRRSVVRASCL